jgi:predicted enzyme related to lactoylglutathione lyase
VSQRATWWAITVDCHEPRRVAEFWADLLDCTVTDVGVDRPGWFRVAPRGSSGPFMNFQPVSEPKLGKVRIHVDVLVDDLDAAVDRVVASGGSDTSTREELPRGRIAVVMDPEGHEFCLLGPPRS